MCLPSNAPTQFRWQSSATERHSAAVLLSLRITNKEAHRLIMHAGMCVTVRLQMRSDPRLVASVKCCSIVESHGLFASDEGEWSELVRQVLMQKFTRAHLYVHLQCSGNSSNTGLATKVREVTTNDSYAFVLLFLQTHHSSTERAKWESEQLWEWRKCSFVLDVINFKSLNTNETLINIVSAGDGTLPAQCFFC